MAWVDVSGWLVHLTEELGDWRARRKIRKLEAQLKERHAQLGAMDQRYEQLVKDFNSLRHQLKEAQRHVAGVAEVIGTDDPKGPSLPPAS